MSEPTYYQPEPPRSNVKTALVFGGFAALLFSNVYLFVQVNNVKTAAVKDRAAIEAEVDNLKENSTQVVATTRKDREKLQEDLAAARRQANQEASQAKREALTYTEQQAKKIQEEQRAGFQKTAGEISEARAAATEANAKIADVSGDVTTVKSQVASNKSELDRTITDLKKVTGDLGVTSGYVATNSSELAYLKRLGERNYTEFKLAKAKNPQRIGDVSMMLKKADPKKNRFTFELTADDKKTEKKDRTINEPIQFIMAKAKQPYEIIVNEVRKDMIVGYLAAPKEQTAR